MRVSAVIPTYNSGRLVIEAVRSVLVQSRRADEVIVVDDGSTDNTGGLIQETGFPVRYVRQANQGVAAARNRGLREATGDLIAFLDADDVWHERKLEFQADWMGKRPDLGLLCTDMVDWPNESFPLIDGRVEAKPRLIRFDELVVRNQIVTSSVMLRRAMLEQIGGFDCALHGPEDFDLWLRAARCAAVAKLPLPLTGYRNVPGSLGKQAVSMEVGMRLILAKQSTLGVFRGRPLLERKAWSYLLYSCAYMRGAAGQHARAVRMLLQSMIEYPFPYRSSEVRMPLARMRLLYRSVVRSVKASIATAPMPSSQASGPMVATSSLVRK
jgi:glycosyltransferase involved in cell wall biosynthesis